MWHYTIALGRLQRGRRCSRRRGNASGVSLLCMVHRFNEAGVVHAGEAIPSNPEALAKMASTRPALFTPERLPMAAFQFSGSFGFNEAGVVHAGEVPHERDPLQHHPASTRPALFTPERAMPGITLCPLAGLLQRGRRCSRRRGPIHVIHAMNSFLCFNEAGVVHAGEGRKAGGISRASSRLQRGRRCSRRRGPRVNGDRCDVTLLQRGRRCSRRRGP